MKNRNCPNKDACWDYDAGNCDGCSVGDFVLRQKKRIKRLKSEIDSLIAEREDYKHRADVAERAVREYAVQVGCRSCPFYGRCGIACPTAMDDYKECYEAALRVCAREIEEKRK